MKQWRSRVEAAVVRARDVHAALLPVVSQAAKRAQVFNRRVAQSIGESWTRVRAAGAVVLGLEDVGNAAKPKRRLEAVAILRLFRRFSPYVAQEKHKLTLAAACVVAGAALELLGPWPLKIIFDALLIPRPAPDAATQFLTGLFGTGDLLLAVTAASILVIALLTGVLAYVQAVLLASVGRKVVTAIRYDLYRHIQRLSQSFHDTASAGDLLARLTGDVRIVRDLLVTSVIYIGARALVLIGTLTVMLLMDWRLTLVAVVVLPLLGASTAFFSHHIKQAARRQRKTDSKVAHVMAENLEAMRVIQAYAREDHENERFQRENALSATEELQATRLEASLDRIVQVLLAAGTCAVLWFGVMRVRSGALSPGDLLVFTAYLAGLYKPVRKIAALTGRAAKATACGERILAILDRVPEIVDRPGAVDGVVIGGAIALNDVHFAYSDGHDILKGATLAIEPGEIVAFVSPSGSGKSTIAHLLLRFYEPHTGTVSIDGRDVREYKLASLREQVALLLQEAVLFNVSIRENIAYGRLDATEDEIIAAAKAARAHEFIENLPEGYDTVVGRRGITLSGGQRQRIAIARAMIRRSPIVILDEPATGLDAANEEAVLAAIRVLVAGKTCIIITHDPNVARIADRVFDIRQGRIIERIALPAAANQEGDDIRARAGLQ